MLNQKIKQTMTELISSEENVKTEPASSSDFRVFGDTTLFTHFINLTNSTVLECIDQYVNVRSKASTKSAERRYSQVKMHLINIQKENDIVLYPIVIGDVFWKQFHQYLLEKNLATSTINNICCRISAVLKWSAKYGAKVSPTLEDCYMPGSDKKPKIALTQDEVSRITYFDINTLNVRPQLKKTLERVRDQFVISCALGQRISDIERINKTMFHNNVLTITQQKTGNKAVIDLKKIAPYPQIIEKLLAKYDYTNPYKGGTENYNKYLHMLFKYAGFDDEIVYEYKQNGEMKTVTYKLYQLISSHTARRTMITNAIKRGMHNEEVRRASGHKSETAFGRYVCWND